MIEVFHHALKLRRQRGARVGQHDLARGAVQQLETQLRFQLDYGAADGRLRQPHRVAGTAEIAPLGNGQKDAELS